MGGSGKRVKKWEKNAFCGQKVNFDGKRNFNHRYLMSPLPSGEWSNKVAPAGPKTTEFDVCHHLTCLRMVKFNDVSVSVVY